MPLYLNLIVPVNDSCIALIQGVAFNLLLWMWLTTHEIINTRVSTDLCE